MTDQKYGEGTNMNDLLELLDVWLDEDPSLLADIIFNMPDDLVESLLTSQEVPLPRPLRFRRNKEDELEYLRLQLSLYENETSEVYENETSEVLSEGKPVISCFFVNVRTESINKHKKTKKKF